MMKNPQSGNAQSGNAMVYVLIVIALFGALSYVLSRQTDTAESGTLQGEQLNITANDILQTPAGVKQSLDQMMMSGTKPDDMDFMLPSDANFNTPPNIDKVYHPDGGGVTVPPLSGEARDNTAGGTPAPGWYMGKFNNVDWTPTAAQDVILVAYQIKEEVCAKINESLTGSSDIPELNSATADLLIDANITGGSGNTDFTAAECPDCENKLALCVKDSSKDMWSFYNIIEPL